MAIIHGDGIHGGYCCGHDDHCGLLDGVHIADERSGPGVTGKSFRISAEQFRPKLFAEPHG